MQEQSRRTLRGRGRADLHQLDNKGCVCLQTFGLPTDGGKQLEETARRRRIACSRSLLKLALEDSEELLPRRLQRLRRRKMALRCGLGPLCYQGAKRREEVADVLQLFRRTAQR